MSLKVSHTYKAIVIGVSSGGLEFIKTLITAFPVDFSMGIVIVQHLSTTTEGIWIKLLDEQSQIKVKEANEKESIKAGTAYIAPPNYHLLIESDHTLSLSTTEKVNYARPSIDVLFESAADAYRNKLIGIVGTGANNDGTNGLKTIKKRGGLTIVQDPATAQMELMPASAIKEVKPDCILRPNEIRDFLLDLNRKQLQMASFKN